MDLHLDDITVLIDEDTKEGTKRFLETVVWFSKGITETAYVLSGMKSLMNYQFIEDEYNMTSSEEIDYQLNLQETNLEDSLKIILSATKMVLSEEIPHLYYTIMNKLTGKEYEYYNRDTKNFLDWNYRWKTQEDQQ